MWSRSRRTSPRESLIDQGTSGLSEGLKKRVRLTNIGAVFGAIVMAATVPLDAEVARRWMVAVDVASVFIFVAIILANRRGHVTAARVTLVIGGLLLTSTNAIALGRESGADLLFVALLAVPFALFDLSERTPMVTGLVLTLLALVACACGVLSPTPLAPTGLRFYEAYSLVLAVVIVLFTLFQNSRENARVESALRLDIVARERAERELAESRQAAITAAKLAALGEMSASVAHEVNNPLSVILMRSQRLELLARAGKLDAPAVLKTASEINRTVDRIRRVVDALRAFARQREEDPLRPELLAPIVADTVELCEHRFRQRGVGLNVDPIPDGLQVLCRAAQIAQVLLNLLSNGYDAVENQSERWVRITVAADEQEVHIAVLDSGPGVPQEIAARIMEPFYTTKEIGRGTGLGLSLSEGIAAAHGGRLEL
ncbi:MAG TPA: ATP-binding protein, partial [Polyangia bacterium]|nr:ATP-binding protein [Polyangia bacterium]